MADDAGLRVQVKEGAARARRAAGGVARRIGRRRLALGASVIAAVALLALAGNWLIVGRFMVSTDNAYVRADITRVAAEVGGYVRAVPAAENQHVDAGDVLLQIDPADYQNHLAAARAALAQAQGGHASQQAGSAWAAAEVRRYQTLAERGLLSPARMQELRLQQQQANGGLASASAAIAAALAQVAAAQLDLDRTTVRAPIAGVVGDRLAQVGQYVAPGTPLMSVVPLDAVYVVANFKETQIAGFRANQPVIVRPDADSGLRLRGHVESLAPASGTEFSIIPTDTATGNFTKIVQRVPVRIRIEPGQEGAAILRPGLSATVTVDTRK